MPITLATGNKKHALSERGADLYETPPVAVHALLKAEPVPLTILEPACGPGSIVRTLRQTGRAVVAWDKFSYGCEDSEAGVDFLTVTEIPAGVAAIVTNPPFKIINGFLRKALELCPLVIILARLAFLESTGRSDILDSGKLARVLVFQNRLPFMHRAGWSGPQSNSAMAFAWFVFDRNHQGPTILKRIRWEPEAE